MVRYLLWALSGVCVAFLYVALTGLLGVQESARRSGAIVNLNNEVVGIAPPSVPVAQLVAIAILGVATFWLLVIAPRRQVLAIRTVFALSFSVATLAMVVWSYASMGALQQGYGYQISGWIEQGGTMNVTQLLALLVAAAIVYAHIGGRDQQRSVDVGAPESSSHAGG